MKTLLVVPDYLSHFLPFATLGAELRARGHEVVVATGPGLAPGVAAEGFRHRELVLGPGGNRGLAEAQRADEADSLRRFFAATRSGAVATLGYQAKARRRDLLWRPLDVTRRLEEILADEEPDTVVSDQIAYGATLALRALGQPYVSLLVGHPSALPVGDEVFGVPPAFPPGLAPPPPALAALTRLCVDVERRFTAGFNEALAQAAPPADPVDNAFRVTSPLLTLVNYPAGLAAGRPGLHVGSLVRDERLDPALEEMLERLPRPRVYAALGTFLSERGDVLARVAEGVDRAGLSLVLARGATPAAALPAVRNGIVRASFPQAAVLAHCDAVVCHGGNGTVTEALTAGLPVLAAPFSSDQFAGAATLFESGIGGSVDPNRAEPAEIGRQVRQLLEGTARDRAARLGLALREHPGARTAADLLERVAVPA